MLFRIIAILHPQRFASGLLLLLFGFSFGLFLGALFSDALVLLVGSSQSQSGESRLLTGFDGSGGRFGGGLFHGEGGGGRGLGELSDFQLRGLLVEDDELRGVFLQSLHVEVEGLGGLVLTTVVDGDADGSGVSGGQADGLEFGDGETSTGSHLAVVLDGGASDDRSQGVDGGGGDLGGLVGPGDPSRFLALSLAKVNLDPLLPGQLAEMVLLESVVVFHSHL